MKAHFLLTVVFALFLFGCDSSPKEEATVKTPEEMRAELEQQEFDNPLEYLTDTVTIEANRVLVKKAGLFSSAKYKDDGYLIEGTITNKAVLAKYKDVHVRVSYYSATETEIQQAEYVIYDYFPPNSTTKISLKVDPPSAFEKFGFEIIGAAQPSAE